MPGVKRSGIRPENDANITPLADVTTTLIVVFLITMPAIMGNGIQVNSTRAEASESVITTATSQDDEMVMISITTEGIMIGGLLVPLEELEGLISTKLAGRLEKIVVIVPSDFVKLGDVVDVMDAAKAGGAKSLALLNRKEQGTS